VSGPIGSRMFFLTAFSASDGDIFPIASQRRSGSANLIGGHKTHLGGRPSSEFGSAPAHRGRGCFKGAARFAALFPPRAKKWIIEVRRRSPPNIVVGPRSGQKEFFHRRRSPNSTARRIQEIRGRANDKTLTDIVPPVLLVPIPTPLAKQVAAKVKTSGPSRHLNFGQMWGGHQRRDLDCE